MDILRKLNLESFDSMAWSYAISVATFIRWAQHFYFDAFILILLLFSGWIFSIYDVRPHFRQGAGKGIICGTFSVPAALASIGSPLTHSAVALDFTISLLFILSPNLIPSMDFRFNIIVTLLVTFLFSFGNENIIILMISVVFGLFVLSCLMKFAPGSFTLGEFIMVSTLSSLPIKLIFTTEDKITHFSSIFIVTGVLCLTLSLSFAKSYTISIVLIAFLLTIKDLPTVIQYIFGPQRLLLILYCGIICAVFIFISAYWRGLHKFPQIIQRKFFHLMALLVFVPPIMIDPTFLKLCVSGAIFVFLIIESLRLVRFPYVATYVENYVSAFIDERDSNELILTHLFLLLGLGLPVLIIPNDVTTLSLPFISSLKNELFPMTILTLRICGNSVLAIGDAAASIFGVYFGKHKWPGSRKSYEGTFGAFIGTWITMCVIICIASRDFPVKILLAQLLPAIFGALDEAFTSQIDNLTLPFIMIPPIVFDYFVLSLFVKL